MIDVRDVTKRYGGRTVVDGVSFTLHPGEIAVLVGVTGAGKTTLLRMLTREVVPDRGEVWVAGLPAHRLPPRKVAELRRRVGVVYQNYELLPRLTAVENVAYALRVSDLRVSHREAQSRASEALEAVGVAHRARAFPGELSGGEQQRVSIARAMVSQPAVLTADEPTGNLDRRTGPEIATLLGDVARSGTAVLVVTHDPSVVDRLGSTVLTLESGRLVDGGPAGEIKKAS